jgi:CHAT domain-containing protein
MLLRKKGFNTQIRTGSTATEEFFKQLGRTEPAPHILHLATHGYFFSDQKDATAGSGIREREPVFKGSNDPMIRSGLILAGANAAWTSGQPPAQGEDGILTAYEISQQNLSNTEFVVLSACETGLGQIEGNEGVYGLQRAFKIAGVKYLIMSLWQVNDQKTSELMIEFYRGYLDRKLPVREAFWAARNAMRAKYPGSAYVWAGFVLVE